MSDFRLSPGDPGSNSRPDEAIVKQMHIDFDCDFNSATINGQVTLTVETLKPNVNKLILDTRDLTINKITNGENGSDLDFVLGECFRSFGRKLTISLPSSSTSRHSIVINYVIGDKSTALQWLSPQQTAGKKYPFLFTQSQPDHSRSLLPCQDTPSVKFTFTAQVRVPEELRALMSAVRIGDGVKVNNGKKEFKFEQTIPVPAYLIALAVGNLVGESTGPRSTIWAEPELIKEATYEFAETEILLKTAEDICGPYIWKIYDILVLPPSFPFGGMENACLTFATPTIIAGDRSLVTVISHEISHSWTGNLVSIANFEHFWLNEGFTMFIERKINGRLKGETYRQFNAIGGLKDLKQAIDALGAQNPFTKLVVDLNGIDPDDAFSVVPYEKGSTFLYYLEQLLGGAEIFEAFLRSYFDAYKFKSVSTEDFKNYLIKYFKDNEKLKEIEWDNWLYTTGMPYKIPQYDNSLQIACVKLVQRWTDWNITDLPPPFSLDDLANLMSEQIEEFTALLLENDLSLEKVKQMDKIYELSNYKNSEIKFRWLKLCIKVRWLEKVEAALKFATEQGRIKFSRPIFRNLYEWEEVRSLTIKTFYEYKNSMMYVLVKSLLKDLHLDESSTTVI